MLKLKKSSFLKSLCYLLVISILNLSFKSKAETVTLEAGTNLSVETISYLSSETLMAGLIIDFKVRQDVIVDDKVVIKAGSIAKGQVERVSPAKGIGKAGYIAVKMKSVEAVDGTQVSLTGGDLYNEGEDKQTLALVLGILVCILFLTIKGENAYIPSGYEVIPSVAISTKIEV